jgi:hypothetical protein
MLFAISVNGQQNPFDVYRKADPSPTKISKSRFQNPIEKTSIAEIDNRIPLEDSNLEAAPEKMATLTPDRNSSIDSLNDNPFNVFADRSVSIRSENPLTKTTTVEIPENHIITPSVSTGDSTIVADNPVSSKPELIEPEPIERTGILLEMDDKGQDIYHNPFNVSNGQDASIPNAEPFNDVSDYNIESSGLDSSSAIQGALPKDKKVKGYFNNILTNYIFWILLGFLVLLTFVVNINRKLIPEISKSLLSDNYLRITYREYNKGFTQFLSYLLYTNFFAQAGVFMFLAQKPLTGTFNFPWYYFIGGITGIYLVRHLVLWVLGSLFPVQKEASQFSFVIMQFNLFLGLILFGLNWLLAFGTENLSKPVIFAGLGSILIMFLLRQFRGLLLGARILSHYKFHFFLYLCAVEFAPLLLLYKVISANFS